MKDLKENSLISLQELSVSGLVEFYVEKYQRGYRWETNEINSLLSDIDEHNQGSTYCMQPIVVSCLETGFYELIDGQQRMTTMRIILSVLQQLLSVKHNMPFGIRYATRDSCVEFFNRLNHHEFDFLDKPDQIAEGWEALALNDEDLNIDNFHLYQAYQLIAFWLRGRTESDLEDFRLKLWFDLKVIWYPVDLSRLGITAESLFQNINSGKIKLTSAELIKALFILDINEQEKSMETRATRKTEFANDWDMIERRMHHQDFWFFINNKIEENYETRIGLLFDILTGSFGKEDYQAYMLFADRKYQLNWQHVKQLFQKIDEWYERDFVYHRIGFLVNSNRLTFEQVVAESDKIFKNGQSKQAFYQWLQSQIGIYLKDINLSEISYEKDKGKFKACHNVLLLYNILVLEKSFPGSKFPFGLFVEQEWSLEHIHPQNPQEMKETNRVLAWLEDTHLMISEGIGEQGQGVHGDNSDTAWLKEIEALLIELRLGAENFNEDVRERIRALRDGLSASMDLHGIGNLALLDKDSNSKIGNRSFAEKRRVVLKLAGGSQAYIPLATVNCFMKKTSIGNELQMTFWSISDTEYYSAHIKETLSEYYG